MVRLRGKPCPLRPRLSGAGGDEAMRANKVPLGVGARRRAAGTGASPSRQASVGSKTRSAARSPISY